MSRQWGGRLTQHGLLIGGRVQIVTVAEARTCHAIIQKILAGFSVICSIEWRGKTVFVQ